MQKAIKDHYARQQGGPFKLNLYPKEYFDENPFRSDRPLPKLRKSKPAKHKLQPPFRPSSPAKKASHATRFSFLVKIQSKIITQMILWRLLHTHTHAHIF